MPKQNCQRWPIWLIAAGVLVSGLVDLAEVLCTRLAGEGQIFKFVLPFWVQHWSRSAIVATGFALIYLAWNLAERKHVAWILTVCVSVIAVLAHIGHGQNGYIMLAPMTMLFLLAKYRCRFTVRSDPGSLRKGTILMLLSIAIAFAYGILGFWLMDKRDFGLDFSLGSSFLRTVREFTLVGNSDLVVHTSHGYWFLYSLDWLGLVTGFCALFSLFCPLAYKLRTLPQERLRAKEIVSEHGCCALDFYKLWPDKSYLFSDTKDSFIAYKVGWGVAFSLGDPVGPAVEQEKTIRLFMQMCQDNGWRGAFLQALPYMVPIYKCLGLDVLKIGEEAIVNLKQFCTSTMLKGEFGRKWRKLTRDGYKVEKSTPPHVAHLIDEVEAISKEWLSIPGRRERGFSLGQFSRDYAAETELFVLRGPDGKSLAFVNQVPSYRKGEATIDLMRHTIEMPSGGMEYLFMGVMQLLHDEGYVTFNLGLAALSGVGDYPGATLEERAVHQIYEHLNAFFSYKGLRHYKAKFEPQWEESFLVYESGIPGLIKTSLALANVAEG